MLRQSPALTTLDLSGCQLPAPMVTYLCAVLQHQGCGLQTLRWRQGWEGCWGHNPSTQVGVGAWGLPLNPEEEPLPGTSHVTELKHRPGSPSLTGLPSEALATAPGLDHFA